jgi:hypothetical protein
MRTKFTAILAPALALGVLAVTAEAQQHKAIRLGNPATRFAKPLKKADDLRVLLRSDKMKADVAAILNEVAWKGNIEDLDRAAAAAEISEVQVPTGTRLPFMASRKNTKPHALVDVLWAGPKPIDAFAFEFSSNCVRYRLVTPKACSNFWIEDLGRHRRPEVGPRRCRRSKRSGAARLRRPVEYAEREEPAGRQQGDPLRERQGARLHQLTNGAFKPTFTGAPTPARTRSRPSPGGGARRRSR